MATSVAQFNTRTLRRSRAPDEYRIYRAALEWGLMDPVVVAGKDDLKSARQWQPQVEPFDHQLANLVAFFQRLPASLIADDTGLGKTVSAGLIASELIARSRASRVLVVCGELSGPHWREELRTRFNIPAEIALGKTLGDAGSTGSGAVITTYDSARLYLDRIPEGRFELLVLDEVHALRNLYGLERPEPAAVRFRDVLEKRRFRYVLMLTGTLIQQRLWDLYSLADLLATARGHANPFGSESTFARKFIADNYARARQLNAEVRDEFRSIVGGYLSRTRRDDAKLNFPEREIQQYKVRPSADELELIRVLAEPIQTLSRSAQITLLSALSSSPQALMSSLGIMARNGTLPADIATAARAITDRIETSSKLEGLGLMIDQLKQENPRQWRLVIFTGRLETQAVIQAHLESQGIGVGIVNGSSGERNHDTLARFRKEIPAIHVIISTDTGSEGLDFRSADVIANYDLPWHPMLVEQRIDRLQRLAPEPAKLSIRNITLRGTFEETIVGRLMERIQAVSRATGDIEPLLEAVDIGYGDKDDSGFDETVLQLVLATLAGREVEVATRQTEKNIIEAKAELDRREQTVNSMLGTADDGRYVGPRAPMLPPAARSMDVRSLTLAALAQSGARLTQHSAHIYQTEHDGERQFIRFDEAIAPGAPPSTLYMPGSPAFTQMVNGISATGIHDVIDPDGDVGEQTSALARKWASDFDGELIATEVEGVSRSFRGNALVRVQATVAHDSCERLVEVPCDPDVHGTWTDPKGLQPISELIEDPAILGINSKLLADAASRDPAIAEFCRFYVERRAQEAAAASFEARKRKKLEEDFTPQLQLTLVGLQGLVNRNIKMRIRYKLAEGPEYSARLTVVPGEGRIVEAPPLAECALTGQNVPRDCLQHCEMTGKDIVRHRLMQSQLSGRFALPEYTFICNVSKQRILSDEAGLSDVSGEVVTRSLLKRSAISGKFAEPDQVGTCEFTQVEALMTELGSSEISGKRYRTDEQASSQLSGKAGHRQEFVTCHETQILLAPAEGEKCEVTGHIVKPGLLQRCTMTRKAVLPSELETCAVSDNRALKSLMVTSNVSNARMLEGFAIRSANGTFCTPFEARRCNWSGRQFHPDDLRTCALTGIEVHFEFATTASQLRLKPLSDLLAGSQQANDGSEHWTALATRVSTALGGHSCRIEAAQASPDGRHLAVCAEVKSFFGMTVRQAGLLYNVRDNEVVGRIALGKRGHQQWSATRI